MEHTDNTECFACAGFSHYIGSLGDLDWYLCCNCGFEQYQQTTPESSEENPE